MLDAVDRVWSECTLFETDDSSFWSEPIVMPPSKLRTAGLVIGNVTHPNRTLAYWQIDMTVVVLEVEGEEMWTFLDPLLTTLCARLDGTPTSIDAVPVTTIATTTPDFEEPQVDPPAIVPATLPPVELPPTTTELRADSFPPSDEDWAEHRPRLGIRSLSEAEPADPDDAIEGCDAPVPPNLDG